MSASARLEQARTLMALRRVLAQRSRLDRAGEDERAAWRAARLAELRRHAVERSPRYRAAHRGLTAAPLEELPVVTKADVVERFDEIVTDPHLRAADLRAVLDGDRASGGGDLERALGRYRVAVTSGSSGRPGAFPFDAREWVLLLAGAARARAVAGPAGAATGRVRSARVGSPGRRHLSRQLASTLSDPRKPSLELSAAAHLDELVHELGRFRPDVLSGYASVLGALATEQVAGRLDIRPRQVLSGGEVLTAATRRHLREAWGAEPVDQYLTTEAGFVAIECPAHAGLHVQDDHVVVEVVDDAGERVEPGAVGTRVLLTVLGSRTVPLIRYQLEDIVALAAAPCPCGRTSPRLASIAGTPRELLRFPSTTGGTVTLHPVALTAVLDGQPVRGWQVAHGATGLQVRVVAPQPSFAPAQVAAAVRRAIEGAGAISPEVRVDVVDRLERSAGGKSSLVVGEAPPTASPAP